MDEFHTCRHLLDHKFPCFVCLNPLKKPFPGRDWDCNGLNIASFESQLTRGSNSIGPNQGCDKPATPRPPHPPCQALATRTREILRKRLVGFMDSYKVMPHSWISCAEKTPICHVCLALRQVFHRIHRTRSCGLSTEVMGHHTAMVPNNGLMGVHSPKT